MLCVFVDRSLVDGATCNKHVQCAVNSACENHAGAGAVCIRDRSLVDGATCNKHVQCAVNSACENHAGAGAVCIRDRSLVDGATCNKHVQCSVTSGCINLVCTPLLAEGVLCAESTECRTWSTVWFASFRCYSWFSTICWNIWIKGPMILVLIKMFCAEV